MMNALRYGGFSLCLLLVLSSSLLAAESPAAVDLRRAVPAEAYLAVYGSHNSERDYQRQYYEDIWQTVKDERLPERILELVSARVPDENMQQAQAALDELKELVAPVDWQALADSEAVVYAAVMEPPTAQHLVLIKLTPAGAAGCETAIKNLLAELERRTEGKVPVVTKTESSVELTTIGLPPQVPFHPTVARLDGVLILSTSEALVRQSLGMLQGSGQPSKFDDPRLKEALAKLPAPEDALVFFDGRQLFTKLADLGTFIRQQSHGDEKAAQVANVIEQVMDQFNIVDYAITSEYTEDHKNCSETLIKLLPNSRDKVLGKMTQGGQPFDQWQQWVPADATAYSLRTGANLHPLYEMVVKILRDDIPEGNEALDQFRQIQDQLDVHLDEDILQAFSGEYVSVTLPPASPSPMGGADSVFALRCSKPERIRELLHRAVEGLQQVPAVKAQQLALTECKELKGFDKLSLSTLAMMGAEPVIGFHDGWMFIGSRAAAVEKVLALQSGDGKSAADTERFQKFGLKIDGAVDTLSYTDLAASTHQSANTVRQLGMIGPMFVGMAGAQADPKDLQPVLDALKLLPSIAKVIDKFDFFEAKLCVTQAGSEPDTYVSRCVTLVRPPQPPAAESAPADAEAATTATP